MPESKMHESKDGKKRNVWFAPKPCPVCAIKDAVIERLRDDLKRERLRLARAEERGERALDELLKDAGKAPVTPPQRWSASDADKVMQDTFAIFKDADDHGDGNVRDVDNLDFDHH